MRAPRGKFSPAAKAPPASAPRRSRCSSPPQGRKTASFPQQRPSGDGACRSLRLQPHSEPFKRPVIQQQQDKWQRHQHRLAHQSQGEKEQGQPVDSVRVRVRRTRWTSTSHLTLDTVFARSGRKKSAPSRPKQVLNTSLRSATHATDSTCTGCSPNNAATSTLRQIAPGQPSQQHERPAPC